MAITLGVNGYVSLAEFKSWCTARGYDYLNYLDSEIEAAIVIASVDFIDANYAFLGTKLDSSQSMQLPTDKVDIIDVANPVSYAVWLQLQGKLFVSELEQTLTRVTSESASVGSISESKTYETGYTREYTYSTTKIDRLIRPYIVGGGIGLMRA